MRAAVPILVALALAAGEPLTATAWDVRKDADELFEDLERRRGDQHDLLERARRLLDAHGHELVSTGDGAAPLGQVLWQRLERAGAAAAFAATLETAAERRLRTLGAADTAGLTALAWSAPGTAAARAAWRRLADLAWDDGRLAGFRAATLAASDEAASARRQRLALAASLDAQPAPILPHSFAGVGAMWRLPLTFAVPEPDTNDELRLVRRRVQAPPRPALSLAAATAVALSDGRQLSVIDHLTGNELGSRISLGERPLPSRSARPALGPGGFIAAGIDGDRRLVLLAVDTAGRQQFRISAGEDVAAISAPAIRDGVVAIAYLRLDDERSHLRLAGFAARDGQALWDTVVTLVPAAAMFGAGDWQAPELEPHALGFAVLSNAGVLGLVGSDGHVRRLWSYPSRRGEPALGPSGQRADPRIGALASDGGACVATPADQPGLVLTIREDGATRSDYRGDGADGDVVAVQDGLALLCGRQVTLLDLAAGKPLWSAPGGLVSAWGAIGTDTVLLADGNQLLLLARQDGRLLGNRALGRPSTFATGGGILVVADAGEVRGFGDAADFLRRLEGAMTAAPADPRPAAALAGVLAGRGEVDRAVSLYQQALDLGADAAVAERLARLLRARLDGPDPARSARALDELRALAVRVPQIRDELPLWQARLAEANGSATSAGSAYRTCLATTDRLVPLADGLSVSLHLLAHAGLGRLAAAEARSVLPHEPARPVPLAPAAGWRVPLLRHGEQQPGVRFDDRLVVGYAAGLLTAWRLADGSEAWWRMPTRTMLGVSMTGRQVAEGVPIDVIPGTAADSMGLKSGDTLLAINGQEINDFRAGLMPAVQALAVRAPVTFAVQRGDERLTIQGQLGGEPVEPVAISPQVVLARTTMATDPQRADLRFFALDPATGAQLWTHTLPAETDRMKAMQPRLTPGGIVVAADGQDLVGLDARDGSRRWTIPGRSDLLPGAQVVGGCLWLTDSGGITARLIGADDGRELATVPAVDPLGHAPLLDGVDLAVRDSDGRIACWELGRGRLRFRTPPGYINALAMAGAHLIATDPANRLVVLDRTDGTVRRVLLDGALVRTHTAGHDRLVVLAESDGRQTVACIAYAGGAPIWSLRLPVQIQVAEPQIAGDNTLLRLRHASGQGAALVLDAQGRPSQVATLPFEAPCHLLAGGLLAALPDGLLTLPARLPDSGPAVACPQVGDDPGQIDLSRLAWQPHPDGTWASARIGGDLLLAVRGNGDIAIRLADAMDPLAAEATLALTTPGLATRVAVAGAWMLAGTWQRTDAQGQSVALSRWRPPAGRPSGQPLRVRIGADAPQTPPWWWTAAWARPEPAP